MALGWLCWRTCVPFGAVVAAAVCCPSAALGDIDLPFGWQARRLTTSTYTCVAGVALLALGWLWWRVWVSDEHVSCIAPPALYASLRIYFKCPTPANVVKIATMPSPLLTFSRVHKTMLQRPKIARTCGVLSI